MATKFYLCPRADKAGEHPIRVSISIKGTRLVSTAGFNISKDKWNEENHSVKKGYSNEKGIPYNIINARLLKIKSHFAEYENLIDHKPSIDELATELAKVKGSTRKKAKSSTDKPTPLMYFDMFIREQSKVNQWADGTLVGWQSFRKHIQAQGENLTLEHFDESGINGIIDYFRRQCGMEELTLRKEYRYLKWWLTWCYKKGYTTENAIEDYRPKFRIIDKPVIFLTKEELMTLYHYSVPDDGTIVSLTDTNGKMYKKIIGHADTLRKVKDCFCFCCFTSLRYSDMAKLKKSDRCGNILKVVTKKTNDAIEIDLNNYSAAILDKYADKEFADNLALPYVSNEVVNDYIKELGELCGFNTQITRVNVVGGRRVEISEPKWKLLTSHTGRKTFICYALGIGIPPQVVMKWTGHSDYATMKPYIDIAETAKADAMKMFNETMEK